MHNINTSRLQNGLMSILDGLLMEARGRCKKYDSYVQQHQRSIEGVPDDATHTGTLFIMHDFAVIDYHRIKFCAITALFQQFRRLTWHS